MMVINSLHICNKKTSAMHAQSETLATKHKYAGSDVKFAGSGVKMKLGKNSNYLKNNMNQLLQNLKTKTIFVF